MVRSLKRVLVGAGTLAIITSSLAASVPAFAQSPAAGECNVGVSWNNFQQRRWAATDKPNMQATIEAGGGTFSDADANLDTEQQITDVQTLIEQGADVLIILAQDLNAIGPAVQLAKDNGIPIIAYDRLIEDPDVLYITFDNVGVGRAEAAAMFEKVPSGNYVLIKGDPGDPNASTFLPQGWDEAGLADKIAAGEITVIYESFTNAWDTGTAQDNMEAAIQQANANGQTIDAVLAENDSTALGVVAALVANGLEGVPVSGQDGDPANLNNVAKGLQYVDVWKNSNELGKAAGAAALQLCAGTAMADLTLPADLLDPGVVPTAGLTAADFTTPGGNSVKSFILQPTPLTAENLQLALDGGWIDQATLCDGVTAEMPGAAVCGAA
jgi:D-xylose transport system substrate-binding protein